MNETGKFHDAESRADIVHAKYVFGLYYGAAAGFGFALTSWAWDGYLLENSNAYYPWIKLLIGLMVCVLAGGLAGWIKTKLEHGITGMICWLVLAVLFAWLTVALPLKTTPEVVSRLNPQLAGLLNYNQDVEFTWFLGVALIWIAPFMIIIGLLQDPVVEPAVFSTSSSGRILPFLISMVMMGMAGLFTDGLINARFRDSVIAMDNSIQFVLDHRGQEVDPAEARNMFAGSLRSVGELVSDDRKLFVGSFNQDLGQIQILVHFKNGWVVCNTIYNQPSYCKQIPDHQ